METLYLGDCLEVMKRLDDKSIDMVLADLPYGTTACRWDEVIPMEPLWEQYNRVTKENAAMLFFASQPFAANLIVSNLENFKYEWIWDKKIPGGMSYARFQPMRQHETILIFCKGRTKYNPQMILRDKPIVSGGTMRSESAPIAYKDPKFKKTYSHKNPTSIISFDKIRKGSVHPTQKPTPLLEYLIKTYTNEGDTVLDNVMGSGSTGVACKRLNRKFVGIEKEPKYFEIAKKRIAEVLI